MPNCVWLVKFGQIGQKSQESGGIWSDVIKLQVASEIRSGLTILQMDGGIRSDWTKIGGGW